MSALHSVGVGLATFNSARIGWPKARLNSTAADSSSCDDPSDSLALARFFLWAALAAVGVRLLLGLSSWDLRVGDARTIRTSQWDHRQRRAQAADSFRQGDLRRSINACALAPSGPSDLTDESLLQMAEQCAALLICSNLSLLWPVVDAQCADVQALNLTGGSIRAARVAPCVACRRAARHAAACRSPGCHHRAWPLGAAASAGGLAGPGAAPDAWATSGTAARHRLGRSRRLAIRS